MCCLCGLRESVPAAAGPECTARAQGALLSARRQERRVTSVIKVPAHRGIASASPIDSRSTCLWDQECRLPTPVNASVWVQDHHVEFEVQ